MQINGLHILVATVGRRVHVHVVKYRILRWHHFRCKMLKNVNTRLQCHSLHFILWILNSCGPLSTAWWQLNVGIDTAAIASMLRLHWFGWSLIVSLELVCVCCCVRHGSLQSDADSRHIPADNCRHLQRHYSQADWSCIVGGTHPWRHRSRQPTERVSDDQVYSPDKQRLNYRKLQRQADKIDSTVRTVTKMQHTLKTRESQFKHQEAKLSETRFLTL